MSLIHYISRQMLEPPLEIKILRPSDLNYRFFLYAFQIQKSIHIFLNLKTVFYIVDIKVSV